MAMAGGHSTTQAATSTRHDESDQRPGGRRILIRTLAISTILLGLILAYTVALPWYAQRVVAQSFGDLGFPQAQFTLRDVSPWGIALRDVQLDRSGWGDAQQITIGFTPISLMRGSVGEIEIRNGRWRASVINNQWRLIPAQESPAGSTASSRSPFPWPEAWPFTSIAMVDCAVQVDDGSIVNTIHLDGSVQAQNQALAVHIALPATDLALPNQQQLGFDSLTLDATVAQSAESVSNTHRAAAARGAGDMAMAGEIAVTGGRYDRPSAKLQLAGATLNLPFAMQHAANSSSGSISISSVQVAEHALPPIQGRMELVDRRLSLSLGWQFAEQAALQADGSIDFSGTDVSGQFDLHAAEFELDQLQRWWAQLPGLGRATLSGRMSLGGSVRVDAGNLKPAITVRGVDLSAASPRWGLKVDRASTAITLTGFSPLSTQPDQIVTIDQGSIGSLPVNGGRIQFTVADLHQILIDDCSWSMNEYGRFLASRFEFDPYQSAIRTTVTCEDIGLGPWLKLLSGQRVSGQGTLSGLVTVSINPGAREWIRIGNGVLEAGRQPGYVQMRDPQQVQQLLSQVELGGTDARLEQVRDQIVAALQDFVYSQLRVEFIPSNTELLCQITTAGKGRTGDRPAEFGGITVNLHEFDQILRSVLWGKSLYDQMN